MNGAQAQYRSFRLDDYFGNCHLVGERSVWIEVEGVTHGGLYRSDNAGMSSDKAGEKPARRKPKVS